jgi:hypothetical protein
MQKPLSKEEIECMAMRMGLETALRDYPETLHRAASRVTDYATTLPAGWTASTEPA